MWNILFANPVSLACHYLLLFFYGTSMESLHEMFATEVKGQDPDIPATVNEEGIETKTFDFVVVGGGSAGAVVASRLTEENYTVLLIEAGGYPFPLTSVPAFNPYNLNQPEIDWMDKIVPQPLACRALKGEGVIVNRGKMLGGGSSLNYMLYMRGSPSDFNHWANVSGDPAWRYNNVLPYFKKMENYDGHFPDENFHAKDGPLHVSKQDFAPLTTEWLEAGSELGFETLDPNKEQTASFFPFDTTTKDGTRFSTHRAYIYPALLRDNFKLKLHSHATKIQIEENRATGVYYHSHNRTHLAVARKEVIVSAGAIGSPQLLMLSGIGPKTHLKSMGIPVEANLPVGENLQDHIMVYVGPFLVDQGRSYNVERDLFNNLQQYIEDGKGPFSGLGVVGGAIIPSTIGTPGYPDIFLKIFSFSVGQQLVDIFRDSFNVKPEILDKYFEPDFGKDSMFLIPVVALPKSRGHVRLQSTDPFDRLEIDPKYFSHPDDFKIIMEGIKWTLNIAQTEAFKKIGAKLTESIFPGCEAFGNASNDEYWECYARQWTHTVWHFSGTNAMGMKGDPGAVVDSQLKVIGVDNLRVMDASIMPTVTTTNTNAPTIMIAEHGSAMVKSFWENRS